MSVDYLVFRIDCPPQAFPTELRCFADGMVMLAGVGFFGVREDPASAEAIRESWPAIEAECRRIFGEGWRK